MEEFKLKRFSISVILFSLVRFDLFVEENIDFRLQIESKISHQPTRIIRIEICLDFDVDVKQCVQNQFMSLLQLVIDMQLEVCFFRHIFRVGSQFGSIGSG